MCWPFFGTQGRFTHDKKNKKRRITIHRNHIFLIVLTQFSKQPLSCLKYTWTLFVVVCNGGLTDWGSVTVLYLPLIYSGVCLFDCVLMYTVNCNVSRWLITVKISGCYHCVHGVTTMCTSNRIRGTCTHGCDTVNTVITPRHETTICDPYNHIIVWGDWYPCFPTPDWIRLLGLRNWRNG